MKIGVVIPAYNVGKQLDFVLSKTLNYIPPNFVYVVDDGSFDSTAEIAVRNGVVLLIHKTNRGKGEALKSGFKMAIADGLDGVITMDGDGQHDPAYIPEFISIMKTTGADIVLGRRQIKIGKMPLDRVFSNFLSSLIISIIVGKWVVDTQCGFRLIRTAVLRDIFLFSSYYEIETELLIKAIRAGFRIAYCPISLKYGDEESHIRRFADIRRFCQTVIRLIMER